MSGRIDALPRDSRGYPVPWFVAWIDGVPDFRIIREGGIAQAVRRGTCWVCGGVMGGWQAFVIGPMCAINRISAEPPSHVDCAEYSAQHCPFLVKPAQRRRGGKPPEGMLNPAGIMCERNPGVALVWVTHRRTWSIVRDPSGGVLFNVGDPERTAWWAHGRTATRDEVLESIESGLPILMKMAVEDGPDALDMLARQHAAALQLVPAA